MPVVPDRSGIRRGSVVRALLLGGVALPIVLPLFSVEWFESHEAASYPARLVEVGRCWEDGMLSARWFPDLAGGRGYPFLSFYAPLSFWLAGALHAAGFPVAAAWKGVILAATLLGIAGAYRLARTGMSAPGAFTAAVFYAWAPYHLRDLWTRGDLAEYLALGFLPWAVHAMLRIGRHPDRKAVALASLAGGAAILSHNVVGLLTGLTLAWAALLALPSAGGRRGSGGAPRKSARAIALALGAAGTLALSLSSFFWVPALAERSWVQLENLRRDHFDVERNWIEAGDVLGIRRPERELVPGRGEPMTFELGAVIFPVLLAPWAWWRAGRRARRVLLLGAGMLLAGVFLSTRASSLFYDRMALLRFVGFPWRFLSLASLGAALLAGGGAATLLAPLRAPFRPVGVAALTVLAVAPAADLARPLAPLELRDWMLDPAAYRDAEFTASVANEYVPIWARARENIPFRDGLAATGPARFEGIDRGVARWRFRIEAARDVTVVLRDYFYPGWRGTLDGRNVEIVPRPGSGHAQFECPAGSHDFAARLEPTRIRRGAGWVSAAALVVVLLGLRPLRVGGRSPQPRLR